MAKQPKNAVVADGDAEVSRDTTWKDNPNAQITRVFRQIDWYKKPSTKKLGVANLPKRQVAGTDMPAVAKILKPNHALQYVLDENAECYERQLKGLRQWCSKGFLEEIDPAEKGKIGIPPYVPTEIEKENARLRAELEKLKEKLSGSASGGEKNPEEESENA